MKVIAFLFTLSFSLQTRASEVCGLYQVEDFRSEVVVSLIDFTTYPGMSRIYNITNHNTTLINSMVAGECYCAEGIASPNPAFSGDTMYQLLTISYLTKGPYGDCSAPWHPPY